MQSHEPSPMSQIQESPLESYERLKGRALERLREGQLRDALEDFEGALELARLLDDADLVDRATCNRCRVAIELGSSRRELADLGKILLRNRDPEIRFLAAYNLTRAHLLRKDSEKALFYGGVARQEGARTGRASLVSAAHNGIGLALLSSSYFEEAEAAFAQALELLPDERRQRRGVILDNYGYCKIVRGEISDGFRALFESLRLLRRTGERWFEMITSVSLCFAYLEVDKFRAALRHGARALEMARRFGDRSSEKSALFLLGEAAKLAGDELGARRYFARLQEVYYPDAAYLPDMLMLVDARSMVNLKA